MLGPGLRGLTPLASIPVMKYVPGENGTEKRPSASESILATILPSVSETKRSAWASGRGFSAPLGANEGEQGGLQQQYTIPEIPESKGARGAV